MSLRTAILPVLALLIAASGCTTTVLDEDGNEVASGVTPCQVEARTCDPGGGTAGGGGDEGEGAVQYCTVNDDGQEEWTACCTYDIASCECTPPWASNDWECSTPLVLAFQNEAVSYTTEMAGSFDLTGVGLSVATDWPTAATPWLALDRDGNDRIDDGGELFGSATILGTGERASNGFVALGALDDNGDGVMDARDAAFAKLVVWRDTDASRTSTASELSPAAAELEAIELSYSVNARCDERGNCEMERASFRYTDSAGRGRAGSVVDVHLRHQQP